MFDMIKKIVKYPRLTQDYPNKYPETKNFICNPIIDTSKCTNCGKCIERCPSNAIVKDITGNTGINQDECIVCTLCEEVCQNNAIKMTNKFDLAKKKRDELRVSPLIIDERNIPDESYEVLEKKLAQKTKSLFQRSLQIREVDAGSCNGCDNEINAINNPFNDIERLGIHFVASPRHADMLLVTGTATRNMELALIKTYNATPEPKLVVAVGACACSGGIFRNSYATRNGIDQIVLVDVYIPGCPPRPQAIIYGILMALEKL
jgi:Ni,Fe-hydrogenase III small subunit/Pyruvate/2-oxoacid:ferredoxin oxidoreductase delta subunit